MKCMVRNYPLGRYPAKLNNSTGRLMVFEDAIPLESAVLFKHISDEVWKEKPEHYEGFDAAKEYSTDPAGMLAQTNQELGKIDKGLVISSYQELIVDNASDDQVILPGSTFVMPEKVWLSTRNFDKQNTYRTIRVGDEIITAEFENGHCDYSRELSTNFVFPGDVHIQYLMHRDQEHHHKSGVIFAHAWYRDLIDDKHTRTDLFGTKLTESQETDVLKLFAKIGNISLAAPTEADQ